MRARAIVLPITEPETEWVRDRPLRKVSPKRHDALPDFELPLRPFFATALDLPI